MRMSIVTSMEELQEGDHLVSEEIYKEITVLLLSRTHPEWGRPTQRGADLAVGCAKCSDPKEAHPHHECLAFVPPNR